MIGASMKPEEDVTGEEHWTDKGDIRLFLWEKYLEEPANADRDVSVLFTARRWLRSRPLIFTSRDGPIPRR